MNASLNRVIVRLYSEFDTPVDSLVTDDVMARRFVEKTQARLGEPVDGRAILRRLLNLRKSAALPRLRH